jgi:hypothetical protein
MKGFLLAALVITSAISFRVYALHTLLRFSIRAKSQSQLRKVWPFTGNLWTISEKNIVGYEDKIHRQHKLIFILTSTIIRPTN